MRARDSWQLLVFRDGRRVLNGNCLRRELLCQVRRLFSHDFTLRQTREELSEALLRSGEMECASADQACQYESELLAKLTDALARALIVGSGSNSVNEILKDIANIQVPDRLSLAVPEGFCYYALHPLDYADLLHEACLQVPAAAVVGIRSIGTTLSAVVNAWFLAQGISSERITVRPTGHPFDRRLSLNESERAWIGKNLEKDACFFVVDEGPGLSGSSFLAVAESLIEVGVPIDKLVLLPSAKPNLSALLAPEAATRWRFQTIPLKPTRHIPSEATTNVGVGKWRSRVFNAESEWPAVWPWTERHKYLSAEGDRIFRFDGHGHYGNAVRDRSQLLAQNNWGPEALPAGDGFSVSPWLRERRPLIVDHETLTQLAQYCAFRADSFACESVSSEPLEQMTNINLKRGFGSSLQVQLPVERPVIADARMMPIEWIYSTNGRLWKLDAATHGDDHFYPGPTDIAWDLAGAIVEWNLDSKAEDFLVAQYQRCSDDNVQRRLPVYRIAYAAFRFAFSSSAALSVGNIDEQRRFETETRKYRARLENAVPPAVQARGY